MSGEQQPNVPAVPVGKQPAATDPRFDIRTALAGAAIAVLIMSPITYKLVQHGQQQVERRLADAPPVAILDFSGAVATFAKSGGTNEDVERMVRGVDETVRKLSGAGFLVLDAKAVLSAPKALYVPQNLILGIDPETAVNKALGDGQEQATVDGAQNLIDLK